MKQLHSLLLTSLFCLALSSCVSSSDSEPSSQSPAPPDTDEVQIPDPVAPSNRLACEDFEANADSAIFSPLLDLTTYPSYDEYNNSADAEPEAILAIFTSLLAASFDAALVTRCTFDLFEANACGGISTGSLEDGVLNWTVVASTSTSEVTVNDSSYSSGSIINTQANGEETTTLWTRADDGTETYSQTESTGRSTTFTEFSDCSGTATFVNVNDDGSPLVNTTTTWTSPIVAIPSFVWEFCDYENGVEECRLSE